MLLVRERVQVAVFTYKDRNWIRVSCQIYNDESDIEYLGKAVLRLKASLETSPAVKNDGVYI